MPAHDENVARWRLVGVDDGVYVAEDPGGALIAEGGHVTEMVKS